MTLYQGGTGTLPFAGDDWYDVMRQHVDAEPPAPRERNPQLSTAFEAIVLRCLAKDPADRFQSAGELADALAALRMHGAEAATLILPALPARPRRSRRGLLLGGVAGALAIAAAGAWLTLSDGAAATRARLAGPAAAPDSARARPPAAESALTIIDTAPLPPPLATLVVDAPVGASVFLDGQRVARGPWRSDSVTSGRPHVLRASLRSLDGCPTAEDRQKFTLAPGETRQLQPRIAACGQLGLDVRPPRGRFTLSPVDPGLPTREGSLPLATPLVLPEGWYRLSVRASLCGEFSDSVRVTAGAVQRPSPIILFCPE